MHLSTRSKITAILFIVLSCFLIPIHANAAEISENYYVKRFEARDGLKSAEVNAIIQTDDHYIWVGSYSGLYKYDGLSFSNVLHDKGVLNVMSLYSASDGHLWIGTNDSGVFCYNPITQETMSYTVDDGLNSNSIRSICEDHNGTIYLGGLNSVTCIERSGAIQSYTDLSIPGYVQSLCCLDNGIVVGVTNSGVAGCIKDGKISLLNPLLDSNLFFCAVAKIHANHILLADSNDQIYEVDLDSAPTITHTYDTGNLTDISSIKKQADKYFICCRNGLCYLDSDGEIHEMYTSDFSLSICDMLEDYQGNDWVASDKLGVAKLSKNPFGNPLRDTQDSEHVVNAIAKIDGQFILGCDDGIIALSDKDSKPIDLSWTHQFEGLRIRHLYQDTKGNIWVSTYSQLGLVCIAPDGTTTFYNEENSEIMGNRCRFVKESKDGTLYASNNSGLTIFENGVPVKTLDTSDGLKLPSILDLVETENGRLLAATDGGGIYIIKNQQIIDHIGQENGLKTLTVLKIIPCTGGYIYITSNALYYDDGTTIKSLKYFPYSNCYDMFITQSKQAWICSSAGIYVVNEQDLLLDNEEYPYILLNNYRGLDTTLTANAWHHVDAQGTAYLCTSTGIRTISIPAFNSKKQSSEVTAYIKSIVVDGVPIEPDKKGIYQISADSNRISVTPAVLNYDLSTPIVRIWMEGFDDVGVRYNQSEQSSVSFTNLPPGTYNLKVQIINEQDHSIIYNELSVPVVKHEVFYKRTVFHVLSMLCLLILASYFTWLVIRSSHYKAMQKQYLRVHEAKAEAERANRSKSLFLARMSHEIRTPINSIMGMNEFIMEESDSAMIRNYAHDIETSSHTLLSLIDEILEVAKLDSDKLSLSTKKYYLPHLIREVFFALKVRGQSKGLEIVGEFDENLPTLLVGDELRLKEVIMNLISNAVKYTQKGTVSLHIKLVEDGQEHIKLGISVTDTGIGISPEDQKRIFNAFERLDNPLIPHVEGTGLGLHISQKILSLMHSELEVASEVGKGSDFHFIVEQKRASTERIGSIMQDLAESESMEKRKPLQYVNPHVRILVVDDTALNLKVAKHMLEKTQAQVDTVQSGEDCLKLVVDNQYDIVFLDDMMPNISGTEVLQWIKSHPNKCSHTPIIVLTANVIEGTREKYLSMGFDEYLPKPIRVSEIERILHTFLPEVQDD